MLFHVPPEASLGMYTVAGGCHPLYHNVALLIKVLGDEGERETKLRASETTQME
jgi:hypothetical protein